MKTRNRKAPTPEETLPKIDTDLDGGEVCRGTEDYRQQCLEDGAQPRAPRPPFPSPPKGWGGDLPSWLDHCAATGWGEPHLAWCEEVRAWRQGESASAGGAKEEPSTKPYFLVSAEEIKAPKYFVADLEQLRHHEAGDREIDLLAVITNDEIAKAAEERTGRKAEEILSKCTLLTGDFQFLDSWIVVWPNGFAKAEDQFPVRLLLLLAWSYSTRASQNKGTDRALASVSDAIVRFRAGQKLAAENRRRRAGGVAAAMSEKRSASREAVMRAWASLNNMPKRYRATIIAKRLGIAAGQVRRHVKKAGLR